MGCCGPESSTRGVSDGARGAEGQNLAVEGSGGARRCCGQEFSGRGVCGGAGGAQVQNLVVEGAVVGQGVLWAKI